MKVIPISLGFANDGQYVLCVKCFSDRQFDDLPAKIRFDNKVFEKAGYNKVNSASYKTTNMFVEVLTDALVEVESI